MWTVYWPSMPGNLLRSMNVDKRLRRANKLLLQAGGREITSLEFVGFWIVRSDRRYEPKKGTRADEIASRAQLTSMWRYCAVISTKEAMYLFRYKGFGSGKPPIVALTRGDFAENKVPDLSDGQIMSEKMSTITFSDGSDLSLKGQSYGKYTGTIAITAVVAAVAARNIF